MSKRAKASARGRPFVMRKGISRLADLVDGVAMGMGVGNIYIVSKTADTTNYAYWLDKNFSYPDGSWMLHTTIQSALDATVDNRNDYVIVTPSQDDYDLTAALTMSKKAVHLISPAGLGYGNGANNATRIHQTGAFPIIEISDSAIEIAGFYFKNYATKGGLIISDSTYGLNIHHNYWAMSLSGATNEPMLGPLISNSTGDAGAWSTIDNNFFQSQAGANATIAAIIRTNAQATGTRIVNNVIAIGDTNNTATVGIQCLSVKGIVSDNDFYAHQTSTGAGVFTHCVQIGASGCAYGNRGNVADGELLVGGTDELSFILNYNSVAGGTQDEQ